MSKRYEILPSGEIMAQQLQKYADASLEIADVYEQELQSHQGTSDEFTFLSPVDNTPFQDPSCVGVMGNNGSSVQIRKLAEIFFPDVDKVVDQFIDTRADLLDATADALLRGEDVTAAVDHRQVLGVAIAPCVLRIALEEHTDLQPDQFYSEITLSNMLKYTSVRGLPAVDVAKGVFSVVRFASPTVNEKNKILLPEGYSGSFNAATRQVRDDQKDGQETATMSSVAYSGTRDIDNTSFKRKRRFFGQGKDREENPLSKAFYIAAPSTGTIEDYFMGQNVIGFGVDLEPEEPEIYTSKLYRPRETSDEPSVMNAISDIVHGTSRNSSRRSIFVPEKAEFLLLKDKVGQYKKDQEKAQTDQ